MEDKKVAVRCTSTLPVYIVGLGLFLAGYSSSYWTVSTGMRRGLFDLCLEEDGSMTCNRHQYYLMPGHFVAVLSLMSMALVFSLVAGAVYMYLPISGGLQIAAAVCIIIASALYGHLYNVGLYWSFALSVVGGGLFLISGVILVSLSAKTGCSLNKTIPGQNVTADHVAIA